MDDAALRALRMTDDGRSVHEIAEALGLSDDIAGSLLDEAARDRDMAGAFWSAARSTAEALSVEQKAGRFDTATFMRPVLSAISGAVRKDGFRRRGTTFVREPEQGLLLTVAIWTGRHYPSGPTTTYGHSAVDLLVDLDDLLLLDSLPQDKTPRVPLASHRATAIRARLGADVRRHDMWWPMAGAPEAVAAAVVEELVSDGLPFLARFESRDLIERELRISPAKTFARPVPLLLAALHLRREEYRAAFRLIAEDLEREDLPPAQRQWHERYLQQLRPFVESEGEEGER